MKFLSSDLSRRGAAAALCLLAGSAAARAEIRFESERVVLKPKPDEEQVSARFEFRNHGTAEVEVVSVASGCQCLEATATTGPIAPGAGGSVAGVFKVGNQLGTIEKGLQVRVKEEGKNRTIHLVVAVEVRQLVIVEPRTVAWVAGEEPVERTFKVTMDGEKPIRLLEVEASRPGFDVRMEVVEEGGEYLVHVKPLDGSQPALGVFHFKTDCEFERFAQPIAFGHVRNP